MRQFAFSMNGQTLKQASDTLRSTLGPLISSLKNTAANSIRAVSAFEYRFWFGMAMWAIKKRWHMLKHKLPVYRELGEWQRAYWQMHDEWSALDLEHRSLYIKYQDLLDEVKYWEKRHSKVLYFIEKNWIEKEVEGGK